MSNKNTKPQRKESMSIRIEPQLRYLIDIASRVQRRSLTNYVEWVLEEYLKQTPIRPMDKSISDLMLELWDVNESERLIKLACIAPELLTYDEQLIFKILINEDFNLLIPNVVSVMLVNGMYQAVLVDNPECDDYEFDFYLEKSKADKTGKAIQIPLEVGFFEINQINEHWDLIKKTSQGDEKAKDELLELTHHKIKLISKKTGKEIPL